MSHYEQRLQRDLDEIRNRVDAIGATVSAAIRKAVHAFLTGEKDLAAEVILGDRPVNREVRDIDHLCHTFVVRHLPSAGHLRFVSSVLRLNVELERVGDYAVTICREAAQISERPPSKVLADIELIAGQASEVLDQSLLAFRDGNADLARGTMAMADQVQATFQRAYVDLLAAGKKQKRPVHDLFALLVVLTSIGRVADQAKNTCEQVVFATTGEVKRERTYRILFLDARNDGLSQIAEAYARKAFPRSGEYESAGWEPAPRLSSQCRHFLDRNGYDAEELSPKGMPTLSEELARFHLVIGLEPGARDRLPEIPFRTVVLEWDLGPINDDLDQERSQAMLEAAFKKIADRMHDLMETLRGDEAN